MPHLPVGGATPRITVDLLELSPSAAVFTTTGGLDLATEKVFRDALEDAVGRADTIVVDLCGVTFMGSVAVPIIVNVLKGLSTKQAFKLVTGRTADMVLRMLGMNAVLDCFPCRSSL
ncbi:STAS domain-containing protein [Pseudonocardia acidicola]|uniref:STAS domain-containing protein n=1 Tax=Pseudonocardia acidicola TaxID=2724939 RepID=A0ABX1S5K1_9PSEU|nr:STAS domain-containing protein [Pseudonocardia acidicola]NMH96390.1 STAS domain-containing protein [Pseudonocardia acidicola]